MRFDIRTTRQRSSRAHPAEKSVTILTPTHTITITVRMGRKRTPWKELLKEVERLSKQNGGAR